MNIGPTELATLLVFALSPLVLLAGIFWAGHVSSKAKQAQNVSSDPQES